MLLSTDLLITHENVAKDNILQKRREHITEIRSVLKGRHILTTEGLYNEVKVCKGATHAKQAEAMHRGLKTTSVGAGAITVIEEVQEPMQDMIGGQN